jgi:hypothetical protein
MIEGIVSINSRMSYSDTSKSKGSLEITTINRGDVKFEKFGLTFYILSKSHFPLMASIYTDPYANAMVAPVTHPTKQDIQRKLGCFIDQ